MKKLMVIFAALLLAAACTKVRIQAPGETLAGFVCALDWSGVVAKADPLPDTLDIVSSRILRSKHHFWPDVSVTEGAEDTLRVLPGEYQTLLFAQTDTTYRLLNIATFEADSTTSIRSVVVEQRPIRRDSIRRDYPGFDPLLVSYFDTLGQAPVLYRGAARHQLSTLDELQTVTFPLFQQVQTVTIRVQINADEGVVPQRLVGCITGVPMRVELISGYLNIARLGQTLFELFPQADGWWEGEVHLLGIKASDDATLTTGAGILRLGVSTLIRGRVRNIMAPPYNLYQELQEDPLLVYTDQEGFYRGSESVHNYIIATPIHIKGPNTIDADDDAVALWDDPENGQTEDIVDGDNEE